mmetsp:Transcript_116030/g.308633  ORF Transcript_116030/g.308633 Transcript_116030/m.308633 type:complete len:117 (-) Transcript_116030:108-458(-)
MVQRTEQPCFANVFRTWTTVHAACESSPERGSSKNSILGFVINSAAIAVRFFSPPDIPRISWEPTYVSAHFSSRRSFNNASTLSSAGPPPQRRRDAERCSSSRGVSSAGRASSCMT